MNNKPNPMDELTIEGATDVRDHIISAELPQLRAALAQPCDSAERAKIHLALADQYEEVAVLDAIALTDPDDRAIVLPAHNDIVRLFRATGEAEAARSESRPRQRSAWSELEDVAGHVLDAITRLHGNDNVGLLLAYRQLRERLRTAGMTAIGAPNALRCIEDGYLARRRAMWGPGGEEVRARITAPAINA